MNNNKLLKKDMIKEIANISGFSQADTEKFLDAFHILLLDCACKGVRVQDVGYFDMTFNVLPARRAFIPNYQGTNTSVFVDVKESKRISLKAGKLLKKATNQNEGLEELED